jgi:hypothetical protein
MIKIFYSLFKSMERKMVVNVIFLPYEKNKPNFPTVPYICSGSQSRSSASPTKQLFCNNFSLEVTKTILPHAHERW